MFSNVERAVILSTWFVVAAPMIFLSTAVGEVGGVSGWIESTIDMLFVDPQIESLFDLFIWSFWLLVVIVPFVVIFEWVGSLIVKLLEPN